MSAFDEFISELRRRAVIKVAAIYAALAWLVLQFADLAFPRLGLPDWTITFVLVLAAIGFPIALIVAWIFERTPEGLKVTAALTDAERSAKSSNKIGDFLIIGVLSLLVGLLYVEKFISDELIEALSETDLIDVAEQEAEDQAFAPSIAVMPFINLSTSEENAFFAAGMHEDVMTQLSRINGLKVISRTSMMRYEGKREKSIPEIARELNVNHILEGSVRRAGNDVRITFQLIDASKDGHIWAENYDRKLENIFAVQSEVARIVAQQLEITLSPETVAQVERKPTESLKAYDDYLKGRELLFTANSESIAYFKHAIDLDPLFAEAYAGLAQGIVWSERLGAEWQLIRNNAYEVARKGVALKPASYETNLALGRVYYQDDRYADAELSFTAARALNENGAEALLGLADIAMSRAGVLEALQFAEEALQLDPLNAEAHGRVGRYLVGIEPERALVHLEKALELDPSLAFAYANIGNIAQRRGDYEKFYDNWRKAMDEGGFDLMDAVQIMNFLLTSIGAYDHADRYLDRAMQLSPNHDQAYFMRVNLMLARTPVADRFGPAHGKLVDEWLAHNPSSTLALRNQGDYLAAQARRFDRDENHKQAMQFRKLALRSYEQSMAPFRKPDGHYVYQPTSNGWTMMHYAGALFLAGETQRGQEIMENALEQTNQGSANAFAYLHRFYAYAWLERDEDALDALEDAYDSGFIAPWILESYLETGIQRFRNNIRYVQIVDRINARNDKTLAYINRREAAG